MGVGTEFGVVLVGVVDFVVPVWAANCSEIVCASFPSSFLWGAGGVGSAKVEWSSPENLHTRSSLVPELRPKKVTFEPPTNKHSAPALSAQKTGLHTLQTWLGLRI